MCKGLLALETCRLSDKPSTMKHHDELSSSLIFQKKTQAAIDIKHCASGAQSRI